MHRGGYMHRGVCSAPRAYMSMSMHTYVSMSIVHVYVYMCSCSVVPRAALSPDLICHSIEPRRASKPQRLHVTCTCEPCKHVTCVHTGLSLAPCASESVSACTEYKVRGLSRLSF